MAIQYACFISYRHPDPDEENFARQFIDDLTALLKERIGLLMDEKVYIDSDQLHAGDFWELNLSKAICNSVCMIVVYTPKYFSKHKIVCTREFLAMKTLEEKRLASLPNLTKGFIIPVVLRGEFIPDEIGKRQYIDLSPYTTVSPKISANKKCVEIVEQLAKRIFELYSELEYLDETTDHCSNFNLPSEEEVRPWLQTLKKPKPPQPLL